MLSTPTWTWNNTKIYLLGCLRHLNFESFVCHPTMMSVSQDHGEHWERSLVISCLKKKLKREMDGK